MLFLSSSSFDIAKVQPFSGSSKGIFPNREGKIPILHIISILPFP